MCSKAVMQAIDDGHFQKSVKVKISGAIIKDGLDEELVCRICNEPMPCKVIMSCRAMPQQIVDNRKK